MRPTIGMHTGGRIDDPPAPAMLRVDRRLKSGKLDEFELSRKDLVTLIHEASSALLRLDERETSLGG